MKEVTTLREILDGYEKNIFRRTGLLVHLRAFQEIDVPQPKEEAQRILDAACKYYGVVESQVKSKNRKREVVNVRKMFALLCSEWRVKMSLLRQADMIGNYDHSDVIHHRNTARDLLQVDPKFRRDYEKIKEALEDGN